MKKFRLISYALLMGWITMPLQADDQVLELQDNTQYAQMQQCLAAAEESHNLNTQLDRYCIDSFLATRIYTGDSTLD